MQLSCHSKLILTTGWAGGGGMVGRATKRKREGESYHIHGMMLVFAAMRDGNRIRRQNVFRMNVAVEGPSV